MTAPLKQAQGFTLIELLTVIAIIGILIGFIAVGLPRAIESAKIAKIENTFLQIRNILTEYYVDHGTFPPAYGYLDRNAVAFLREQGVDIADLSLADLNQLQTNSSVHPIYTRPWMDFVGAHNNRDLYDNFSIAYDTDRDGYISRLEFSPLGVLTDPASQNYRFDLFPYLNIYNPDNPGALRDERDSQLNSEGPRPILYFPVNKRLFRKVAAEWFENDRANPRPNDSALVNGTLVEQRFPPPTYDAYVLISVGPSANTWGMIYELASGPNCLICQSSNYSPAYYYHILGMATYFMATRDAENRGEGDGELDFEFRARTRRGQGDHPSNKLPDPAGRNAPGPMIFVGEA